MKNLEKSKEKIGKVFIHAEKCESISMKERYEKNPIPQMLSNAKIRAKQKVLILT